MDHGPVQVFIVVQQFLRSHPLEQHWRVVGKQHLAQLRIDARLRIRPSLGNRQQAQVVVAQRHHGGLPKAVDQPQGLERLASPIDQVAAEPKLVLRRIEAELSK
jgi:hypothetical protein